jgi:hypothetical protein
MPKVLAALALLLCPWGLAVLMYLGYVYDRLSLVFFKDRGREIFILSPNALF